MSPKRDNRLRLIGWTLAFLAGAAIYYVIIVTLFKIT